MLLFTVLRQEAGLLSSNRTSLQSTHPLPLSSNPTVTCISNLCVPWQKLPVGQSSSPFPCHPCLRPCGWDKKVHSWCGIWAADSLSRPCSQSPRRSYPGHHKIPGVSFPFWGRTSPWQMSAFQVPSFSLSFSCIPNPQIRDYAKMASPKPRAKMCRKSVPKGLNIEGNSEPSLATASQ